MEPIVDIDAEALAESADQYFATEIDIFLDGHPLKDPTDECAGNGTDIGTDCNTFAKAVLTLDLASSKTGEETRSALAAAISAWKTALLTYQSQVDSAQLDLELADSDAKAAFEKSFNEDSKARIENLTATMKLAGVTARQTYEAAVEAAANTLSSAAATLIAAYSAFVTATINAPLTAMNSEATAEQAFWQSVETKRDTTP